MKMTKEETKIYDSGDAIKWDQLRKELLSRLVKESKVNGHAELFTYDGIVVEAVDNPSLFA